MQNSRYEEDRKYYAEFFGGSDFVSVPDSDVQDDKIDGSGFMEIESRHADSVTMSDRTIPVLCRAADSNIRAT